jgi:pimeloyl-ACP methyl ester carboxylesterase
MSKGQRKITLPIGYHSFHKDQAFNFQLNRWYSLGYGRFEDLESAGEQIDNPENWKTTMLAQAENAITESRFLNAAYYFRAAEFFLAQNDPDKIPIHQKFIHYFNEVFGDDGHTLVETPYGSSTIPTIIKPSVAEVEKGTMILHGGYDSYKEELYPLVQHFSELGYKVITFECPWMKLPQDDEYPGLDIRWEKIIKAVLDHLSLDDVTLIGISMGGWLSLRAAAFEPRIKRVIASSVSFDVNQYVNPFAQKIANLFFRKFRKFTNQSMINKMKKDIRYHWFVNHLMYVTNHDVPIEAFDVLLQFNEHNLHSEKVKQDVLILTGKEDHMIPFKMHGLQVKALVNAKSVTEKIFNREDQAQNHCQVGNLGLALDVMDNWIEQKDQPS